MTGRKSERPGEFELIARYFRPLAHAPGAFSLKDDAALLPRPRGREFVVSADMIVEGVHFLPGDEPASLALKALGVNLSDLAAKGAQPAGYLVTLGLPADWTVEWVAAFAAGLRKAQARHGLSLLGGDTTKAPGGFTISVTALGTVPAGRMVRRAGARPGDALYVTGTIGDAALGLKLLKGEKIAGLGQSGRAALIDRYHHPRPRLAIAPALRRHARAALDVSDGLLADLGHLCAASGVGARIEAGLVPLSEAASAALAADGGLLEPILTGGDDYEVLAAVAEADATAFERMARKAGVPVTRIGIVRKVKAPPVVVGPDGRKIIFSRAGFAHF